MCDILTSSSGGSISEREIKADETELTSTMYESLLAALHMMKLMRIHYNTARLVRLSPFHIRETWVSIGHSDQPQVITKGQSLGFKTSAES